jgi:hypothetical protein
MTGDRPPRPLRWRGPPALPADRITASMRLRAVKIAALEAQTAADAKLLRDLRALLPFAAKKLPADILECFDEEQRLIAPYPQPWLNARTRSTPARFPLQIPAQRRPLPSSRPFPRARHARPDPRRDE